MKFTELLKNNPDYFVSALKEGNITVDEAIQTIINLKDKIHGYTRLVYEIFTHARNKKYLNCEFFSKLLNVSEKHCCEMLCNDYAEFEFPVILDGKALLAHGTVVRTKEVFTNVPSALPHLEKLCRILKENLSVFFDTDIVEDSFMLPLYIVLCSKKHCKSWVFTGGLEDNLSIKPSAFIRLKEKVCRQSGKTLFTKKDFSNAKEILDFLTVDNYNVPFLMSFSDKRSSEYLNQSFRKLSEKVENPVKREIFEKISGVSLLHSSCGIEKGNFSKEIHKAYRILEKIISAGGIPHISLVSPASFAMGVGIMLGSQNPVVLYHYQGNEYHKVIDLRNDTRTIKKLKDVNSFEKIRFDEVDEGKDCAFIIQFASHSPFTDVEKFIKQQRLDVTIVRVFHTDLGGITLGDWSCEAAELMSLFQFIKAKRHFDRFHFFLSIPVPIAFAFGMALGHFARASIYQYDSKNDLSYFEAFRLEELQF